MSFGYECVNLQKIVERGDILIAGSIGDRGPVPLFQCRSWNHMSERGRGAGDHGGGPRAQRSS